MNVPILDDAWMERRARVRYTAAMMESFSRSYGRYDRKPEPAPDTPETLREQYASGALTIEQFERRTERMLGCT